VAFWEQKAMSNSTRDQLESGEQSCKRTRPETVQPHANGADDVDSTQLVVEGVSPDEITADFLVAVEEASDAHDLDVRGISVCREE